MYRQFDGYPAGHGKALHEFLNGLVIVNGLSPDETRRVANGPWCLAAQLVTQFKKGPGSIYLYPPNATNCWQDYEYHLDVSWDGVTVKVMGYAEEPIFEGSVEEFGAFCKSNDA